VRRSSRDAARTYLSAPAIRDTCIQPTDRASAPFIGAERVNLISSPSPNTGRESEKTFNLNGAAEHCAGDGRAEAPSERVSKAVLPIHSKSLARRENAWGKSVDGLFQGGVSRCGQLDIHASHWKSKGNRPENRVLVFSPKGKQRRPKEIGLEKKSTDIANGLKDRFTL
jgi:hypothetical protein